MKITFVMTASPALRTSQRRHRPEPLLRMSQDECLASRGGLTRDLLWNQCVGLLKAGAGPRCGGEMKARALCASPLSRRNVLPGCALPLDGGPVQTARRAHPYGAEHRNLLRGIGIEQLDQRVARQQRLAIRHSGMRLLSEERRERGR
jgi:hypothetical protein